MFNGTNLTLNSNVDQDTYMFGLHEISLTYRCIISKDTQIKIHNKYKDSSQIHTQTRARECA